MAQRRGEIMRHVVLMLTFAMAVMPLASGAQAAQLHRQSSRRFATSGAWGQKPEF